MPRVRPRGLARVAGRRGAFCALAGSPGCSVQGLGAGPALLLCCSTLRAFRYCVCLGSRPFFCWFQMV